MKRFFYALALAGVLVISVLTQENQIRPELLSLANAERAFARMSVEKGIRDSFIANFTDDGINFTPHPTNTIEAYKKRQAPATPPPITLNWSPIYGDISQAGDLGYTTGPFSITDNSPAKRPTQHGMYSSIWKKQADGSWKVVIDLGIQLDSAVAPLDAKFEASPQWKVKISKPNPAEALTNLLNTDREFFSSGGKSGVEAWRKFLSDDARIHRNSIMPLVGKQTFSPWVEQQASAIAGEPIKADVAASADFGYSYGKYEIKSDKPEKGYYVRVWKRDANGNWRIVFDVTSPVPEEK